MRPSARVARAISAHQLARQRELVGAAAICALAVRRRPAAARCRRGRRWPGRGCRRSAARSCARASRARGASRSWLSAAKPTQYGPLRQRRHGGEDVGVLGQLEGGGDLPPPLFLILCSDSVGGAPVGHRGGGDEHVVPRAPAAAPRRASAARCLHVDARHAARRGQVHRAGDQRDLGAGLGRRARDREAHLAAGQVGDAAHRVDRPRRSGRR